jgi:hypothetical protein
METPRSIRFSGTIKESTDGAEMPEEDTRRNIGTTDTQHQSHPRGEQGARRHTQSSHSKLAGDESCRSMDATIDGSELAPL